MEPVRSRPSLPAGYGVPAGEEGMLTWDDVRARLAAARNYWVSTVRPDGRPHATPVWAVFVDDVLYHGGDPATRRARNLEANPYASIHLESGDEVVILEGRTTRHTEADTDAELLRRVDEAYQAKYGMPHGTPVWSLAVHRALAWTTYPTTVTRWTFPS
ncbi:MAG TPA: pyridoxamine 5'-phosphate oxidase family protein [Pseudonocardiaceae bacterium]